MLLSFRLTAAPSLSRYLGGNQCSPTGANLRDRMQIVQSYKVDSVNAYTLLSHLCRGWPRGRKREEHFIYNTLMNKFAKRHTIETNVSANENNYKRKIVNVLWAVTLHK